MGAFRQIREFEKNKIEIKQKISRMNPKEAKEFRKVEKEKMKNKIENIQKLPEGAVETYNKIVKK